MFNEQVLDRIVCLCAEISDTEVEEVFRQIRAITQRSSEISEMFGGYCNVG
jgi:bacterioferritin-associated ferredoxin